MSLCAALQRQLLALSPLSMSVEKALEKIRKNRDIMDKLVAPEKRLIHKALENYYSEAPATTFLQAAELVAISEYQRSLNVGETLDVPKKALEILCLPVPLIAWGRRSLLCHED